MPRRPHRRKVERIHLLPHIDGMASHVKVELTEISMGGARVQHFQALQPGNLVTLRFSWNEEAISIPVQVVRSTVERYGSASVYLSGLKFAIPPGAARLAIKRLIEHYVRSALENQVANAQGDPTYYKSRLLRDHLAATDRDHPFDPAMAAAREQGYVQYSLERGRWKRTLTWDSMQPAEGFTVWRFEDGEDVDLLCRDYENGSPELRKLIRLCAELSLFVDDTIPAQNFNP